MKKRHRMFAGYWLAAAVVCSFSVIRAVGQEQPVAPPLSHQDVVLISDTYRLWQTLGEKLWVGWTSVPAPIIYVTNDFEYAIGFPKSLEGFSRIEMKSDLNRSIQARKRVFGTHTAASFPFEGIPAVIIGTPKQLEQSPTVWAFTVAHELFHVLQYSRGEHEKVAQLKIGPDSDPSWQLNFPFPYRDADVMRLIHLQGYPLYLAATATDDAGAKYNAGTAVEAIRVYRTFLKGQSPDSKFYNYSQFQELTEGIAFYTEYKMAEAAAMSNSQPTKEFQQLPDYQSFQQVWDDNYKNRLFLVKHAGRAAQSRTAFYHLGLGKGLLLDRLMPDWKSRYFAPGVWLDDLVLAAVGQPNEIPNLSAGSPAPDFTLRVTTGETVSLSQHRGKAVLIDFWQTWCPPCVEELPHLAALQMKYRTQGLVVLGVSGKMDQDGAKLMPDLVKRFRIDFPMLIDEKGAVAGQYNVSGFPHVFIVDRQGRLVYDKVGYQQGAETELEQEILKALHQP